jgi:hypothetical protein
VDALERVKISKRGQEKGGAREDAAMSTLPQGAKLKQALADRGISVDGFEKNANFTPFETAMQQRLLEVMRDEREERAITNAEALTQLTGSLVTATWAVAIGSGALIITSVVQIFVLLSRK